MSEMLQAHVESFKVYLYYIVEITAIVIIWQWTIALLKKTYHLWII